MSWQVSPDRTLIPELQPSRRHLLVELTAPEAAPATERVPVNLALVLDRSGSMSGVKIRMAREAVLQAIARLRDTDRFSVVVYDDVVDVVVPSTLATAEARTLARDAVRTIEARNATDLCGGWLRGAEQVGLHLGSGAIGRCLLLTDGLANHGITVADEIARHAAALRARGVTTSTFGVGTDFDEVLLRRMADAGGGHFFFIENAGQIPDFLEGEVGEVLATTAREVVLHVEAGEGVAVQSLNDFPCTKTADGWEIALGSLCSGQSIDPVISVDFAAGPGGSSHTVSLWLSDRDGVFGAVRQRVTFTAATPTEVEQHARDVRVQRRAASFSVARAGQKALERNRLSDHQGALKTMRDCAAAIRSEAGGDPELLALAAEAEKQGKEYGEEMDALAQKLRESFHYQNLKMREVHAMRAEHSQLPVNLVLLSTSYEGTRDLAVAIQVLLGTDPGLFEGTPFARLEPEGEDLKGVLGPTEEQALVDAAVGHWPAPKVRIVFTDLALHDSWFSHWHADRKTAVVSLAGWIAPARKGTGTPDQVFSVPLIAFLGYEIALHGLRAMGPGWQPETLMHEDVRGCLLDFCTMRTDIEIKLQTGELCTPCQRALEAAGLPLDRLKRIAEAIRDLALPVGSAVR